MLKRAHDIEPAPDCAFNVARAESVYSQIAIVRQSLPAANDMCVAAEGSADPLTPSPPAKKKKTPGRQDQAEQPATVPTGNGKVENRRTTRYRCRRQHIREHAQSHTLHDPLLSGYAT